MGLKSAVGGLVLGGFVALSGIAARPTAGCLGEAGAGGAQTYNCAPITSGGYLLFMYF
jgi:hypothetical protein